METKETTPLDTLMATLQRRWGTHALYTLQSSPKPGLLCIATGFPELDAALQTGGIPRGQISEFLGQPTSGMTSLALKLTGTAQAEGDPAAYIDLGGTFDPVYAVGCGVDLDRLLLVHPESAVYALDIARDLVIDGSFSLIVLDFAATQVTMLNGTPIRSLVPLLSRSNCALVLLAQTTVTSLAALRLAFSCQTWMEDLTDINGFHSRVSVVKNKLSSAQPVLDLEFSLWGSDREELP